MGGLAGALFFPTSSTHIGNQSPHIGSLASLIPMSYGSEAKSPKGSVNGTAASSFGKDLLGQGFDRRTCFQAFVALWTYCTGWAHPNWFVLGVVRAFVWPIYFLDRRSSGTTSLVSPLVSKVCCTVGRPWRSLPPSWWLSANTCDKCRRWPWSHTGASGTR